tara:strand:+ start:9475 stop:12603 length:3129 start_codon:yes stop_codon:yes gene_type:complete
MALEWSKAFIPMVSGLEQGIDPRIQPVSTLADCKNGQFNKRGAISKREGFTAFATSVRQGGDTFDLPKIRGIFSTGQELVLIGYDHLYAYNEGVSGWERRGIVSPLGAETEAIFDDSLKYATSDHDRHSTGVELIVARGWRATGQAAPNTQQYAIIITSRDAAGSVILPPHTIQVSFVELKEPRPAAVGNSFLICYAEWVPPPVPPAGGFMYKLYRYNLATPETAPAFISVSVAGEYYGFDLITSASDAAANCHFARVASSTHPTLNHGDIELQKIDELGVVSLTVVLTAHSIHSVLAMHDDGAGTLYVLTHADVAIAGGTMVLYSIDVATYVVDWSVVLETFTIEQPDVFYNLGVTRGIIGGVDTVACTYSWRDGVPPLPKPIHMSSKTRTPAGAALVGGSRMSNASGCAAPFVHEGRAYQAVHCANELNQQCSAVFDLRLSDRAIQPKLVCYLDEAGKAIAADPTLPSPNTVKVGSKYSFAYRGKGLTDSGRMATLDFDAATTVALPKFGGLAISGGFVSWYAGVVVEELGWIAPVGVTISQATVGAAIPIGSLYIGIWWTVDERGCVHRSAPSAAFASPLAANSNLCQMYTSPFTNRLTEIPGAVAATAPRKQGAHYYMADAGGVYRLAANNNPFVASDIDYPEDPDIGLSTLTEGILHLGNTFSALYTESLELEASPATSTQILSTIGERMWFGGMVEPSRVQYSKIFSAGTSALTPAPETNRAFSMQAPNGERVTGLADLDDKIAVFTNSSVYVVAGSGPGDDGSASDFSPLTSVSSDTGCLEARSVIEFPGGVMFRGARGFHMLSRGLDVSFPGESVRDLSDAYPTVNASVLVAGSSELRFVCSGNTESIILVYNYLVGAWSYWEPKAAGGARLLLAGATLHDGAFFVVTTDGRVHQQIPDTYKDNAEYYPLEIQTAWLQAAEQSGYQRVRRAVPLCERLDSHDLTVTVYNDFDAASATQTRTWFANQIAAFPLLPVERPEMRVRQQKSTALKIKISDADATDGSTVSGQGYSVAGLMMELGIKRGLVKPSPEERS